MKVLILCIGNSCRSQMAHGFLQSFDKNIEVYSGGTVPAKQVNAGGSNERSWNRHYLTCPNTC